jgi:hypothetical protein
MFKPDSGTMFKNLWLVVVLLITGASLSAQRLPDHIYMPSIRTVKFFQQNNQQTMPIWTLGSAELLELHFDDMQTQPRSFFYTLQLCNADWTPADVNPFDYIRGFTQNRLTQYRSSSIATTPYVHYQALLPERSCIPQKSGNYLLKVYLNSDTSQLAFTRRLMVVDNQVLIAGMVQEPFDHELGRTHQKVQFSVNTQKLNILNPQQVKAVVLQNNRWDDGVKGIQPVFMRGAVFEYNGEQDFVFPAGKEYRWADLRSFRFLTDRVERIDKETIPREIFVKTDEARERLRYMYFTDYNGWTAISNSEGDNPWWQSDYAKVHFTFSPPNNQPFAGKQLYLIGEVTGNQIGDTSRMEYDAQKGVYTKTLFLKQGYYSYAYATRDVKNPAARSELGMTEGNYWETENEYVILFYYRSFSSRHDELVGISYLSSAKIH